MLIEYEYKVVELNECYCASDLECDINEFAVDGWEFVQVIPNPNGSESFCMILKRLML